MEVARPLVLIWVYSSAPREASILRSSFGVDGAADSADLGLPLGAWAPCS
jgi:hypothetical protein